MKSLYLTVTIALSLIIVSCTDNSVAPTPNNTNNFDNNCDTPFPAHYLCVQWKYGGLPDLLQLYNNQNISPKLEVIGDSIQGGYYKSGEIKLDGKTITTLAGNWLDIKVAPTSSHGSVVVIRTISNGKFNELEPSKLFVNGTEIKLLKELRVMDIKYYDKDWLIIKCLDAVWSRGNRSDYNHWLMYNIINDMWLDFGP